MKFKNKLAHYLLPITYYLFIAYCLLPISSIAQGLLIYPQRLVFDGSKKSQTINLSNYGKDTARYFVSFVQIRMKEDGSFENITKPDTGQYFASPYLRIFPRSVILGPNESQIIKVQLQKTDLMAAGEYRSHLSLKSFPNVKPLAEKEIKNDTSISVKINIVYGISIPVIIRKGETAVKVSLSNLSFSNLNDTIPLLKLALNRIGNTSVYGDIKINLVLPNGKTTKVGDANGLAVYTPGTVRKCQIELIKGIDYSKGKLIITYSAQAEAKAKGEIFAEADLELH